jgi:antitoxin YefM
LASEGEIIVIPRPHRKNVVLLSENAFNDLEKARRNAEYLAKLDEAVRVLDEGRGVRLSMEQLEANE